MLKIYTWLVTRIEMQEIVLADRLKQRLEGSKKSGIFSFNPIFIDLELFALGLVNNLARFLIVLFIDAGHGFNTVFKQQTLYICPYSYTAYKNTQKRLRTFSFGTLATMVVAVGVVSLVMNLLFSDKLTGWAQTFNWTQSSWTNGASSTAIAIHSTNQAGWTRYASSTSNIATTTGGAITLTASSVVAVIHSYAVSSGEVSIQDNNAYIDTTNGGSIKLSKPVGATCTVNTECNGGLAGYCSGGACKTGLVSGPCKTALNNTLKVMTRDMPPSAFAGSNYNCTAPACVGGATGSLVDPQANPGIDFGAYYAQSSCITVGARLPTDAELTCIRANLATYSPYVAFVNGSYWNTTMATFGRAGTLNPITGVGGISYVETVLNVRCVIGL